MILNPDMTTWDCKLCPRALAVGLENPGVVLLCISLVSAYRLSYSVQFTKAVEAKQVAQQEAERARFVVMKADQVTYFATTAPNHPSLCLGLRHMFTMSVDSTRPSCADRCGLLSYTQCK